MPGNLATTYHVVAEADAIVPKVLANLPAQRSAERDEEIVRRF